MCADGEVQRTVLCVSARGALLCMPSRHTDREACILNKFNFSFGSPCWSTGLWSRFLRLGWCVRWVFRYSCFLWPNKHLSPWFPTFCMLSQPPTSRYWPTRSQLMVLRVSAPSPPRLRIPINAGKVRLDAKKLSWCGIGRCRSRDPRPLVTSDPTINPTHFT